MSFEYSPMDDVDHLVQMINVNNPQKQHESTLDRKLKKAAKKERQKIRKREERLQEESKDFQPQQEEPAEPEPPNKNNIIINNNRGNYQQQQPCPHQFNSSPAGHHQNLDQATEWMKCLNISKIQNRPSSCCLHQNQTQTTHNNQYNHQQLCQSQSLPQCQQHQQQQQQQQIQHQQQQIICCGKINPYGNCSHGTSVGSHGFGSSNEQMIRLSKSDGVSTIISSCSDSDKQSGNKGINQRQSITVGKLLQPQLLPESTGTGHLDPGPGTGTGPAPSRQKLKKKTKGKNNNANKPNNTDKSINKSKGNPVNHPQSQITEHRTDLNSQNWSRNFPNTNTQTGAGNPASKSNSSSSGAASTTGGTGKPPGPEMVTIRRHPTVSDTTVTISIKNQQGEEDVLYTLLNGQVVRSKPEAVDIDMFINNEDKIEQNGGGVNKKFSTQNNQLKHPNSNANDIGSNPVGVRNRKTLSSKRRRNQKKIDKKTSEAVSVGGVGVEAVVLSNPNTNTSNFNGSPMSISNLHCQQQQQQQQQQQNPMMRNFSNIGNNYSENDVVICTPTTSVDSYSSMTNSSCSSQSHHSSSSNSHLNYVPQQNSSGFGDVGLGSCSPSFGFNSGPGSTGTGTTTGYGFNSQSATSSSFSSTSTGHGLHSSTFINALRDDAEIDLTMLKLPPGITITKVNQPVPSFSFGGLGSSGNGTACSGAGTGPSNFGGGVGLSNAANPEIHGPGPGPGQQQYTNPISLSSGYVHGHGGSSSETSSSSSSMIYTNPNLNLYQKLNYQPQPQPPNQCQSKSNSAFNSGASGVTVKPISNQSGTSTTSTSKSKRITTAK